MIISIVIVNNNHINFIKKCIESCVNALVSMDGEIIVIDNCSNDGSVFVLKEFYCKIRLIENSKKYGFSKNCNTGIKIARGKYVLILNPDTYFKSDFLKIMCDIAENQNRLGILAPRLVYPDGKIQYSVRRFPTLSSVIVRRSPLNKYLFNSSANKKHLQVNINFIKPMQEVEVVTGACMMIPRVILDKVGLFDERFFLYVEDIDLCYRVKKAGYKIYYTTMTEVIHDHQAKSYKSYFSKNNFFHIISIFKFLFKYKFNYTYIR